MPLVTIVVRQQRASAFRLSSTAGSSGSFVKGMCSTYAEHAPLRSLQVTVIQPTTPEKGRSHVVYVKFMFFFDLIR